MDIGIERAELNSKIKIKKTTKYIFIVLLLFCFLVLLIIWQVQTKYSEQIVSGIELAPPNVGLVFGAGLRAKGVPGKVLEDRILTATQLFQDGQVGKFIMSGDNSQANHNEVQAMKNFALNQGVPEDVMLLDHAGLNTLESCKQVKQTFNLNSIILITQKYHLRRALYLCNEIGVDAVGVAARNSGYSGQLKFTLREYLASLKAWFEINFK